MEFRHPSDEDLSLGTPIPVWSGPVCARRGDTVDAAQLGLGPANSALCRACRLAPPPFVHAVAYGPYQGRMKDAIHALKYDRLHPAAHGLGRMLAESIAQLAAEARAELLVVPVPLHRTKLGQRGFNQARSLATHALRFLSKTHSQWRLTMASSTLMRLRATESQAGLTPHMRRVNLRGAFSVSDPSAVKRKHVLVIDDIFTTGATARAAAQALLKAGAASVWVATLARARRLNNSGRGNFIQDADDIEQIAGDAPAAVMQEAGRLSSQDQPSF